MKKFPVVPILALSFAAFVQAAVGASPHYHEFRSEAGGFSVETPVTFLAAVLTDKAEPHKWRLHMFVRDLGDRVFLVEYTDYPQSIQTHDPQYLFDRAIEGALARTRSKGVTTKVVSETPLSLDSYPGREIVADFTLAGGQRGRSKWHVFLVNNRLYMLMVGGNQGAMTDSEMDKFLDSFRLLSK